MKMYRVVPITKRGNSAHSSQHMLIYK